MIGYFINTSILLKLYYFSISIKWYKLTDYVENKLMVYNVYIHKNINIINVIMLGEWFFDEYYDKYKNIYDDKRYYVLYKLYPAVNYTQRRLKASSINKRNNLIDRDGGKCLCCNTTENLTADHIIPITKGGDSSYYNLQTLCETCNSIKGDKILSISELKLIVKKKNMNIKRKKDKINFVV